MRNVYLSFLGTNDYRTCTYYRDDMPPVKNVRFIQEATLATYCREWSGNDRGFIFATDKAEQINWQDNGHEKRRQETGICEGLRSRIAKLGLPFPIETVRISDGFSEDQIWGIFKTIFDRLEEGDRVIFDITHAFRSIPMLAIVVLNYAKTLKNIQIQGIYYAAFEKLGPPLEVRKIPLDQRNAEVLDLTAFNELLEWTSAIDAFLKSGSAQLLETVADGCLRPIKKERSECRPESNQLQQLAKHVHQFGEVIATCRGRSITESAQNVRKSLDACAGSGLLPAFTPLFDRMHSTFEVFTGDIVTDGIAAAHWCIDHGLIQQGYTILLETLVTHFVNLSDENPIEERYRNIVTSAASIIRKGTPAEKWRGDAAAHSEKTNEIIALLEKRDLSGTLVNLSNERNDLNHAGWNKNPAPPKTFRSNLNKHLIKAETSVKDEDDSSRLAEKAAPSAPTTYADLLARPEDERWELIDGVPYAMDFGAMSPAPSRRHQEVTGELFRQIANALTGQPCRPFIAPFDVRLPLADEDEGDIRTVVQPDISVVCDPAKLDDKGCKGAPDWIIEVVSPSTASRDYIRKTGIYEQHGVREYWIVHPIDEVLVVYAQEEPGRFRPAIFVEGRGHLAPGPFPDLRVDLDAVFGHPPTA